MLWLNSDYSDPGPRAEPRNLLSKKTRPWTENEDRLLVAAMNKRVDHNKWQAASEMIGSRNGTQCQQRWSEVIRPGLRKGPWDAQEDAQLLRLVAKFGPKWSKITENWSSESESGAAGRANRTIKQIRERWSNKLDPNISRAPWSKEEDERIFDLHKQFGSSFSCIARHLPGRVPDGVKTRYKTLNRRAQKAAKLIADASASASSTLPPQDHPPWSDASIMGRTNMTLRLQAQQLQDDYNNCMLGRDIKTEDDIVLSGIFHDSWGVYKLRQTSPTTVHLLEMDGTPMWEPAVGILNGNLLSVQFSNAKGGAIIGAVTQRGTKITWSNGASWNKGAKTADALVPCSVYKRARYWLMHGGPDGFCNYSLIMEVTLGSPSLKKQCLTW
jgi:hypothetical protein